jgi:radical SAM protein with 4Fe4S-binding SPASM domain
MRTIFDAMSGLKLHPDILSWISTFRLTRFYNLILLRLSFFISKRIGISIHRGLPMGISIEPTTSCNLRCPECPSGLRTFSRPTGMLQNSDFSRFLHQFGKKLWSINFYFQGEPFLNKELLEMVGTAVSKGIYTATSTNAHYFNDELAIKTVESGLHRLIVSLDGTTQETYSQYRIGGNLEKVIDGTRRVIAAKKAARSRTPHVIFQFLVVKPNEHQTLDALELAKELGVDEVRFKTAQVYEYENGNPLIPDQEKYSRYRKGSDGKWKLKNKLDNECWRMWQGCVVTWDGSIVPCCFDKDAQHKLGSLKHQSINQIWNSSAYQNFRLAILKDRSAIDICRNCSEGTKVWA